MQMGSGALFRVLATVWLSAAGLGCGEASSDAVPPSCGAAGPGVTDCGPDRESCCQSLSVTGGTFDRTWLNDGSGPTGQADPATLSDFRLDKYLVTVGRYRKFVAAWNGGSGFAPPIGSGKHAHLNGGKGLANSGAPGEYESGWAAADTEKLAPTDENLACNPDYATWTKDPGDHEHLPINCVNWWEAYAFCIWDGAFLPSEAEYQYAAAGGQEQRQYPWGSIAPEAATNRMAIYGCNYPDASGVCSGVSNIAPVGTASSGPGRWGQLDLVGDLAEWNLDWYAPYVTPCRDCANLESASGRVIRDGYFVSEPAILESAYRNSFYPTNRFQNFGFRCARAP